MTSFTEWAKDMLGRQGIPAKCGTCGNTYLDELAMGFSGQLHCRQDIANIAENCKRRNGWRVLDARGRTIQTGSGITLRPVSGLGGMVG
jgi:hypothetical protein